MNLRYPEGFRSTVDAALTLRGNPSAMVLGGTVTIQDGVYTKRFEPNVDIFSLASGGGELPAPVVGDRDAAGALRHQGAGAGHAAAREQPRAHGRARRPDAERHLRSPGLFGRADIDRGEDHCSRATATASRAARSTSRTRPGSSRSSTSKPRRVFARSPAAAAQRRAQRHLRVTIGVSGTLDGRMNIELNSDPPLPTVDIISLIFGQHDRGSRRTRSCGGCVRRPPRSRKSSCSRPASCACSPAASPAASSRAVEQTLGIDTVQISPSLGTETDPLTPTARLIVGKRLSNRAYLTYSRVARDDRRRRSDHHPRVRPVGSPRLGPDAERRQHASRSISASGGRSEVPDGAAGAQGAQGAGAGGANGAAVLDGAGADAVAQEPAGGAVRRPAGRRRRASASKDGRATEAALSEALQTKVGAPLKMAGRARDDHATSTVSAGSRRAGRGRARRRRRRRAALRAEADSQRDEGRVPRQPGVCPKATLRDRITERFGDTPPITRAAEVAASLQELYHERGYLSASVSAAPPIIVHDPDRATLVFDIESGPRTRMRTLVRHRQPARVD